MTENTEQLLERYQRLIELSRDLASTLDLNELLKRIVQAAKDLSGASEASILLYDQINPKLRFEAATNLDEPLMRGITVPVEASIAGWIVRYRQPLIIANTEQDTRHFAKVAQVTNVPTRSLLGVPMIAKDKVVGALEAINKIDGTFTEEDKNILITLGAQAAVAIENARLFQQSDLISELVHELRTPMASLSTAAHLLLRPEMPDEQRRRIVEIIQDETFRISELASTFLDLAKMESGRARFRPVVFPVRDILVDCEDITRGRVAEKELTLTVKQPPDDLKVKADKDKIKQVLLNLLSNAIKYNAPGGKITIETQVENDELLLSVGDTGPGIPPEYLTHLFEKFYRVPGSENLAPGTGLGLAICKQIVEAHHGRIEVNSRVGLGTTFCVRLPLGDTTEFKVNG